VRPQLSVVVPFHNLEAYAAQTIRSLRRNVAADIEFLLVDDGSTDTTLDILVRESERLPGSTVISCAVNGGIGAARNVGVRAAHGEYLTFLDGDDFVTPGYYGALLDTIVRLGCDVVRTDHVQVRGRERSVHRINHGPRGVVTSPRDAILPVERATSVDAPHAWAGIYHRRLADSGLLSFDESLRTCEDRLWNWRLHLAAESFAVVGLLGLHYRRNIATSLTQIADDRQLDFLPAFDQIVALVRADRDADALLPKAIRSYCAVMLHHLGRLDRFEPALAAQLVAGCREALHRLPDEPLRNCRVALDPTRSARLTDLMAAA
jgi:glycosyltransferase involved in cell wall biosynthesis